MKTNFYNRGQSLIGIIIILIVVGLVSGGLYYYLSKQIPEIPEITEKPAEEETVPSEEELPKEEITPEETVGQVSCVRETTKAGVTCGGTFYEDYCENLADGTGYANIRKCRASTGSSCSSLLSVEKSFCSYGCQNGVCLSSSPEEVSPKPEKPVIQKCADGTLYGQCSTNKPKYCDNGNLVDNSSKCGCSIGYEVSDNLCVSKNCKTIYEGTKDHSKAIDVVVIGADDSFSGKQCKYSTKLQNFIQDTQSFTNEFFSISPFNSFKNAFNFYYSEEIVNCSRAPFGFGAVHPNEGCKGWQEIASSCGFKYDIAAVFVNACLPSIQTFKDYFYTYSLSGVDWENNTAPFSEQSSPVTIHEFGHIFGLLDETYAGNNKGPNLLYSLESNISPLCRIQKDGYYEQEKPTDISGGTCYYQIPYQGWAGYSPFYTSNEKSIMKARNDLQKAGFSLEGTRYLQEVLSEVSSIGYDKWLITKPRVVSVPTDQIPTVSAILPSSGKVGEAVQITVTGSDNAGVRSLHVLNFGDNTYADYFCPGMPKTCTYTFTHTYTSTSSGNYYIRVQAEDSLGQGSNQKDYGGINITP